MVIKNPIAITMRRADGYSGALMAAMLFLCTACGGGSDSSGASNTSPLGQPSPTSASTITPIFTSTPTATFTPKATPTSAVTSTPTSTPRTTPSPTPTPSDNTAPSVTITSPTSATTYATTNGTINIAGIASDNVGVTSVSWSNNRGGSGKANGTTAWTVSGIVLQDGSNILTVSASDAAGHLRSAALTVVQSGQLSVAGQVDSSLIDRNAGNAVYIYAGAVVPDDSGGTGANPYAIVSVLQDNGGCSWNYRLGSLPAGQYTMAFTNQAASDAPNTDDAIVFKGTTTIQVQAGTSATQNFSAARLLRVGPGRSYASPSAAAAAAQDGDVIEIDAGEYRDDITMWRRNNLTLRGVGGARAHMRATRVIPYTPGNDRENGMAIWVTQGRGIAMENIEFSGASVPDENGAGIRANGPDLTVCNGYFHDNENGILGGSGNLLVEYSEFSYNGFGTGYTHNMYISGDTNRFTLRYSYSHHAKIGHNVKSRARENYILYNRIMDEVTGSSSYDIDIPDSGLAYIIGNLIQHGPAADNSTIVAYGAESASNPIHELYVVNNTIVNDRGSGTFVSVRGGTTAKIVNNIFSGNGTVLAGPGTLVSNLVSNTPGLVNISGFDYRLTAASAARDAGTDPGTVNGFDLTPVLEYVHPTGQRARPLAGNVDIGAYEYSP